MKPGEFYEFLKWYIKKGDGPPLMLVGLPGVGRRSIVKQVAAEFGLEVIEMEPYEEPIFDPDSILLIRYSPTIKWTLEYRHLVLFNYEAEDQAINEWVSPIHGSLLVRIEADLYDWKRWAYRNGVRGEVISFLNYKPENLVRVLTFNSSDDLPDIDLPDLPSYRLLASLVSKKRKIISPKVWKFVSDVLNLKESLQRELILSSLGRIIGGEFLRFLELYRTVEKGKVPNTMEEWYCLSGLILDELRNGKTDTLRSYWKDLPKDIRSLLYADVALIR